MSLTTREQQRVAPASVSGIVPTIVPTRVAAVVAPAADETIAVATPQYLNDMYWWAYVHPKAVRVFERQWLVNLILWGNFNRLRDAALNALGAMIPGRTLQVACVYGDLTTRLARRIGSAGGQLDVVDVVSAQLRNLELKLEPNAGVSLLRRNSADLGLSDRAYDQALLFFLLHEQPEAVRVVRPGGDRQATGRSGPADF